VSFSCLRITLPPLTPLVALIGFDLNWPPRPDCSTNRSQNVWVHFQEEEQMKFAYGTAFRTFLCIGLLLGSGAFALAQEPTG
jgi:hypothetical protein